MICQQKIRNRFGEGVLLQLILPWERICTCSGDKFLRNPSNKEQLIRVLTNDPKDTGKHVFQSQGDADIPVVKTTLEFDSEKDVVVAADDTDIVVMLCFHCNTSLNNIFFCTERSEIQKVRAPKGRKYWRIDQIVDTLQVSNHILFCHAWSGCDTTSAMYQQRYLGYCSCLIPRMFNLKLIISVNLSPPKRL